MDKMENRNLSREGEDFDLPMNPHGPHQEAEPTINSTGPPVTPTHPEMSKSSR